MRILRTANEVSIQTPAKLNLYLELLTRRGDGFHELETLMTAISIFDSIDFSPHAKREINLQCQSGRGNDARSLSRGKELLEAKSVAKRQVSETDSAPHGAEEKNNCDYNSDDDNNEVPAGHDNIVWRAVEKLRLAANVRGGADVRLLKRIPSAAGLGGASSDAAAALIAANLGWNLNWSRDRLMELASTIGSDIPFFFDGGMAMCRGRGELIESLPISCRLHFVVVRPPVGLSTPMVYQHCSVPSVPESVGAIIEALKQGNSAEIGRCLFNRLEEPAAKLTPWIAKLKSAFESIDCLGHQLSGSGSSYFGVFRSKHHAMRAARRLRSMELGFVFPAHSLGGNEGLRL